MTVLTIKVPDDKKSEVSNYVHEVGGEVVGKSSSPLKVKETNTAADDDEVTHGQFFGENLGRIIKAFFTKH